MVDEGTFREDLYFRVNTFEIRLPTLRDRADDVKLLAKHLIERHRSKHGGQPVTLSKDAVEALKTHGWKGNVRELANTLEYALALCDGDKIIANDLPDSIGAPSNSFSAPVSIASGSGVLWNSGENKTLREIEMDLIYRVLDKHHGDKPRAAAELGIALKTLYNKLNQYEARGNAA
jgi:DNA-binding NtrC family response regulator